MVKDLDMAKQLTIWAPNGESGVIRIIDQRQLPHSLEFLDLRTAEEAESAIRDMAVRGAGLIGATAAYGMYLAANTAPAKGFMEAMNQAAENLKKTRPTAVNLAWAVDRQLKVLAHANADNRVQISFQEANRIAEEDAEACRRIGEFGLDLIRQIHKQKKEGPVEVLTHCNAGRLAFVEHGTATAPIYAAADQGIPVHVWVEETRPRNQGAALTAWELGQRGIAHDVIVDNAGGHVMQKGWVDLVLVGSDRTTSTGDVANKIGTYKTALAARDNSIPFYVALPSSSIDWSMKDGLKEIPIEERDPKEVSHVQGILDGKPASVRIIPEESSARNFGFDITPSRLVTGLITEKGICGANEKDLRRLFPQ